MFKQYILTRTLWLSLTTIAMPALADMDLDYSDGVRGDTLVLDEIRGKLDIWLQAFNAKDADKLFSLYHKDHIYSPANAPLMRGIAEVRPRYETAFSLVKDELLFKEEAIFHDGNMVLQLGAYYFKPTESKENDAPVTGRVALVWHKNTHNQWKLIYDMDNAPPGISPDMFEK